MIEQNNITSLLQNLDERTKELNCIYGVDEALNNFESTIDEVMTKLVEIIPSGWRFTDICMVKICFDGIEIFSENYKETELKLSSKIVIDNKAVGEIFVVYIKPIKTEKRIFLPEEINLLNIIASKLSNFFLLKRLRHTIKDLENQNIPQLSIKEDNVYKWLEDLNLTDDEIQKFTNVQIKFKKGETMCKQGSLTSYTMLLTEGFSKNYLEGIQEHGFNFSIVKPFNFIGLSSLYGSNVYNFSGSALTPCNVYIIENSIIKNILLNNSDFAQNIFKWYCNTTERHLKRLSCIANKQSLGR
ncbi:MAG: Crp/Fnr family transcriptional regulator, partial [Bacteroidetes bacterium]|nr:Crp/Fnr family transcriptional regulator [Bacteroidota bacterium]